MLSKSLEIFMFWIILYLKKLNKNKRHFSDNILYQDHTNFYVYHRPSNQPKKTRRGSPVDDRPSTNKLHHFVRKKKKVTCDTWHVTRDTWHLTPDMWHVTRLGEVKILSKFQLSSSYLLWFMILWRCFRKRLTDLINETMNQWRGCL